MFLRIVAGIVLGGAVGAAIGYVGRCTGGTCPLTCNPIGGILIGAVVGALLLTSLRRTPEPVALSPHLLQVTDQEQFDTVLAEHPVVLVDFYADWCGPCRRLKPTVSAIANEYAGRVAVVTVNVDKAAALASAHAVQGIPDVRIFHAGQQAEKLVGLQDAEQYRKRLDALLDNTPKT
jgi:thioredoxin 1